MTYPSELYVQKKDVLSERRRFAEGKGFMSERTQGCTLWSYASYAECSVGYRRDLSIWLSASDPESSDRWFYERGKLRWDHESIPDGRSPKVVYVNDCGNQLWKVSSVEYIVWRVKPVRHSERTVPEGKQCVFRNSRRTVQWEYMIEAASALLNGYFSCTL